MSSIVLVHPGDLIGKELRETLESRMKEWREVRLLSAREDQVGMLTEFLGAAALVERYDPDRLRDASTVYFCGPIEANRPLFGDVPAGATAVVISPDGTPADGRPVVSGVNTEAAAGGGRLLSPNPAVVLLAHLLHPLRSFQPVEATATVIQPASAQGNDGIEELFEQTRQIVAMVARTEMPVYGTQLSFNLLPTQLDEVPLADLLRAVVPDCPPVPLQVVQGSVFHGISTSLHVRFGGKATPQALRKALAASPAVEIAGKPRHLGPIDSAATDKVIVGTIREDAAGGFWLWAVMDNLTRGTALNAIEIAEAAGG
jgi:aspartate-semialdehyde dehydrogenase